MSKEVLVLMPAYNEAKAIEKVINDIKAEGFENIVVVDDASRDETAKIAYNNGAIVLRHIINRGAGGATATGLEYAKRNNINKLVIIDSDGQHNPKEIRKLLAHSNKHDIVIGSRMINTKNMPIQRNIANKVGSLVTYVFFGSSAKDTQSGFRIFNRKAIENIKISFDRYEFWSETFDHVRKHKMKVKEVPIQVIYTNHSLGKVNSGQSIKNGFKMVTKFLFKT